MAHHAEVTHRRQPAGWLPVPRFRELGVLKGRALPLPGFALKVAAPPMGRSQAVRQRILIPPYGGSNPPAPASLLLRASQGCLRKPSATKESLQVSRRSCGAGVRHSRPDARTSRRCPEARSWSAGPSRSPRWPATRRRCRDNIWLAVACSLGTLPRRHPPCIMLTLMALLRQREENRRQKRGPHRS